MKKLLVTACLFLFSVSLHAQSDADSIKSAVANFFDGLSEGDIAKMKAHTTTDFQLLEHGEVWNMDTLSFYVSKPRPIGYKRLNSFNFITVNQTGTNAWASYFNTASVSIGEKQQTRKWLESVVLKKENGRWKIQLMHSTVMK
jgi:hypothetical protein